MNHAAKELLHSLYSLCDSLDKTPLGLKAQGIDMSLRDVLFVETSQFLMYLSASDGRVKWSEANFISELFNMQATPDQLTEIIKKNNIYSTKFESEVPLVIKTFVKADNRLREMSKSQGEPASILIANFWEAIGKEFLTCDGDVSSSELENLRIYMNTVRSYIRREMNSSPKNSPSAQNSLKSKYELLKKN